MRKRAHDDDEGKYRHITDPVEAAELLMGALQGLSGGLDALHAFVAKKVGPEGDQSFMFAEAGERLGTRIDTLQDLLLETSNVFSGGAPELAVGGKRKQAVNEALERSGLEGVRHTLVKTEYLMADFSKFTKSGRVTAATRKDVAGLQDKLDTLFDGVDAPLKEAAQLLQQVYGMDIPQLVHLRGTREV